MTRYTIRAAQMRACKATKTGGPGRFVHHAYVRAISYMTPKGPVRVVVRG